MPIPSSHTFAVCVCVCVCAITNVATGNNYCSRINSTEWVSEHFVNLLLHLFAPPRSTSLGPVIPLYSNQIPLQRCLFIFFQVFALHPSEQREKKIQNQGMQTALRAARRRTEFSLAVDFHHIKYRENIFRYKVNKQSTKFPGEIE